MGRLDRNPKTDVRQRRALQRLVANNGSTGSGNVAGETPTGTIDGTNTDFELAHPPQPGTLKVYRNGLKLREGAGNDYTVTGTTITFDPEATPQPGSQIEVDYTAA